MARPHPLLVEVAAWRPIGAHLVDGAVVDSAQEHRMHGLLLSAIEGQVGADRQIVARLQALDMADSARRQQLMKVAGNVHRTLAGAGVDHLFFKGVVEAHRLFGRPGERPFADIDVSIRPGQSLSAATAAIAPDFPDVDLLDALVAGGYTTVVSFFEDGQPIDIHTDVVRVGPGPVDADMWWHATVELEVPGLGPVYALDPEAAFVVFVIHQARDRFRYLIGAAEYQRRLAAGLDFDRVRLLAEREGLWEQVVAAVRAMAADLGLEAPVPRLPGLRFQAWERLWGDHVRLLGPEGRYLRRRRGSWLMPVLARGRMRSSLAWIARSAFPPDAHLRRKHPRASGPYWWRVFSTRVAHLSRRRSLIRGEPD